jgi:hypothetical protein
MTTEPPGPRVENWPLEDREVEIRIELTSIGDFQELRHKALPDRGMRMPNGLSGN